MSKVKLEPFRVYRDLDPDEHICIFADPAETIDYCAAVGISKKRCDMPIVYNCRTESSQFGYDLYGVSRYIEQRTHIWPTIAVERNTGQATIHVLTTMNYPDLFRMKTFDTTMPKETEKVGWFTTTATRRKMLDDFALVVKQRVIGIYDVELVDQMKSFIINKKGKATAESNKHDDILMSACGAYQLYQLVPNKDSEYYDVDEWRQTQSKWRFK